MVEGEHVTSPKFQISSSKSFCGKETLWCNEFSSRQIYTVLLAGQPRSRDLIPGKDKAFFSSQRTYRFWDPPNILSSGYRRRFPFTFTFTDYLLLLLYLMAKLFRVQPEYKTTPIFFPMRKSDFFHIIGFFNWLNPSSRTMALGSTQPLT
jgi:hypothetical protein